MADEVKKSLIAKIAEACDAVGGLEKKGKNEKQNYKYLKAADVAKAIRHEFFSRGVILTFDEKEFSQVRTIKTNSGGEMGEFMVKGEFTFHDSESNEKLGPLGAFGVAMDTGDKAIWKAKTGALKYVLRGIGLIPDEKDDPEADEKVDYETSPDDSIKRHEDAFDQRNESDHYLAIFQMRGIQDLAKTHGRTDSQIQTFIKQEFGVERIEKVKKADFDKLKAFVLGKIPIQEALQTSVEATRSDSQGANGRRISEAQLKRLHAIRNAKKVPEKDVKQYVFELKGPESLADLDPNMYKVVCSWLESVQP